MNIKFVKSTRSKKQYWLFHADFIIEEVGILVKGCMIRLVKGEVLFCLPKRKTDDDIQYSPFNFINKELHEEFRMKCIEEVKKNMPIDELISDCKKRFEENQLLEKARCKKNKPLEVVEEKKQENKIANLSIAGKGFIDLPKKPLLRKKA